MLEQNGTPSIQWIRFAAKWAVFDYGETGAVGNKTFNYIFSERKSSTKSYDWMTAMFRSNHKYHKCFLLLVPLCAHQSQMAMFDDAETWDGPSFLLLLLSCVVPNGRWPNHIHFVVVHTHILWFINKLSSSIQCTWLSCELVAKETGRKSVCLLCVCIDTRAIERKLTKCTKPKINWERMEWNRMEERNKKRESIKIILSKLPSVLIAYFVRPLSCHCHSVSTHAARCIFQQGPNGKTASAKNNSEKAEKMGRKKNVAQTNLCFSRSFLGRIDFLQFQPHTQKTEPIKITNDAFCRKEL